MRISDWSSDVCSSDLGGAFVADGNLISGVGTLPFNTDGGGLCNNHPANRGGMTKVIEAVRQLRGEAHPAVQVPSCDLALVHGTGGRSEEHTSELQSLMRISYAVFCLKKKKNTSRSTRETTTTHIPQNPTMNTETQRH